MVNMIKYIKSIITNFPNEIMVVYTSPAVDHLVTVIDELLAKPLPEEQCEYSGDLVYHLVPPLVSTYRPFVLLYIFDISFKTSKVFLIH